MIPRVVRSVAITASTFALLLSARPAAAGNAATAEALFEEARTLRDAGKFAEACPKFEESQRLDAGMGTLYNLGDCYEHIGHDASAWAAFLEVAAGAKSAGQTARETDARARAAALEPKLARLTVRLATTPAPGLRVVRDGVEVGAAQWGTALPVDPGEHPMSASAPGKQTWTKSITVPPGASKTVVDIPALENEAVVAPVRQASIVPDKPGGNQRTAAIVVGAAGVIGVGVGAVFGIMSLSNHADAKKHCDANNFCDATGVSSGDDAIRAGNISTIAFAAGGVFLAGAGILWLTAPSGTQARSTGFRAAPLIGRDLTGLGVSGTWQ